MIGVNLDAVDREILASLTANARIPLVSLASKVHLSRNAVKQRIERMERDGVITGYTLTRGAGSAPRVTAIVMVYRKDRMRGADVTAELARIPEVARCEVMSGEFDLLVTIHADSMDRVGQVWGQIAALPGVENTVTSVSLTRIFERI